MPRWTIKVGLLPLLLTSVMGGEGIGAYPVPREAGFHHCALIYERPQRNADDLTPYVARATQGKASDWLFDAFLFLVYTSSHGISAYSGPTRKVDWQDQLDQWFAPGRDLAALDAAIERVSKDLGPPPSKRAIVLSVPFPNPTVKEFGDVNGSGRSQDLSTDAGRDAVLAWYLAQARERFRTAGYRHLHLWGFYWMREDIAAQDAPAAASVARLVHAQGQRLLWIPYYRAPGCERWRELGIDVAILQPNYAFLSSGHRGRIRRNRLSVTAAMARQAGQGIEIEAGAIATDAGDRRNFLHYLADGDPARCGYQEGATAYYLGTDTVERIAASKNPIVHGLYDALADYIKGRAVPDPAPVLKWTIAGQPDRELISGEAIGTAEARLEPPCSVTALDVFLDEPDHAAAWRGTVEVQVMKPGEKDWAPGGWAVRAASDELAGRWQVVTVPVCSMAAGLRVSFRGEPESPPARVAGLQPDPTGQERVRRHRALGCPYRFLPPPRAAYGDDGTKLTDGIIPETGFASGKTVGWSGTEAAVRFDLGRVASVSRVEVYCEGGSYADVHWPVAAAVLLSTERLPAEGYRGVGPVPAGFARVAAGPPVIDRQRSAADLDGHLVFTLPAPVSARYLMALFQPNGWIMLSEIRIFSEEKNIAPAATYSLKPLPTGAQDEATRYADDALRLTDGIVADSFVPLEVTGWTGAGVPLAAAAGVARQVEVDLGSAQPVRTVTVWSLRGGHAGIYAPASAAVELSADGARWQTAGTAQRAPEAEDGRTCTAAAYRVNAPAGAEARFVRVTVTPSKGWAMLSEIEVE